MTKGVILVSGGMDSLVTAAIAVRECQDVYFLHISYGQRTEARELDAFYKIVSYYQPRQHLICNLDYLRQIGSSSLTDRSINIPLSEDVEKSKDQSKKVPNTYVPFRNALMLAVAVSWAESLQADRVYIGAVEEDSSGYPDCRQTFFEAYEKMIRLGTKNDKIIGIKTPLIHKLKKEIILTGNDLNAPLGYSWSCYKNNDKACGKCSSCFLRMKAFREAGLNDPIEYE